jgi:hypothetical protein
VLLQQDLSGTNTNAGPTSITQSLFEIVPKQRNRTDDEEEALSDRFAI